MPNREEFLRDLAREAGRDLSPQDADALVAEARSHLEDSIQARLELGLSPEEAEREALIAFGNASHIREESLRREPRLDRHFVSVGLGLALAALLNPVLPTAVLIPAMVGLHIAFVAASMNARRLQWAALVGISFAFLLGTATFDATQRVTLPFNGQTYFRARVPAEVASLRARAIWSEAQPEVLARGLASFASGEIDLAPTFRPTYHGERLRLRQPLSREEGLRQWKAAAAFVANAMPTLAQSQRAGAEALEQAAARPWPMEIPARLIWTMRSPGLPETLGAYFAVHFLGWGMGALLRRRPKNRGGAYV